MIQRVQSIFLFILGACMILSLLFTSWQKINATTSEQITLNAFYLTHVKNGEVVSSKPVYYIAILAVVSALVAFYSITRFKNRLLQIKLGALNSLLMAGVLGLHLYISRNAETLFDEQQYGSYSMGLYLPIAAMICNILANRFIRRDENLVRSADRMR
jgi:glucan phosphoethanolaminetransferase (alkaline phosphatase superfamily)